MKDNWNSKEFVQDWDNRISQNHPTRAEQLDILTSIIFNQYNEGDSIIDIGAGSGQVEEIVFNRIPTAKIVGIDSSTEMIKIARNRLEKFGSNFRQVLKNIPDFEISDSPQDKYQFAISVQVLHEISNDQKDALFKKIYRLLEKDGQFLIMDRIKVDLEKFSSSYSGVWKRLEQKFAWNSAGSYQEYQRNVNEKKDTPGSLTELLGLLEKNGFKSTVLHLHFDRALIVGIKK